MPGSPDFRTLLRAHVNRVADQTVHECEIKVGCDWQDHHEDWVRSLIDGTTGGKITAQGIWVEDLAHGSKTELHPMDVIFGSVEDSLLPGDWIGAVDGRHGLVQSAPPLAPYTRPVTFLLPFPAQRPDTPVNPTRPGIMAPAAVSSPQRMGAKIRRPFDVDRAAAA